MGGNYKLEINRHFENALQKLTLQHAQVSAV